MSAIIGLDRAGDKAVIVLGNRDHAEMRHWHLDTFLVEFETWEMHEFATFTIGPDGSISSVDVIGHTFERVPTE